MIDLGKINVRVVLLKQKTEFIEKLKVYVRVSMTFMMLIFKCF